MKKFKKFMAMSCVTMIAISSITISGSAEVMASNEELFYGVRNECGTISEELELLSEERTADYTRLVQLLGLSENVDRVTPKIDREIEIKKILKKHGSIVDVEKIINMQNNLTRGVGDNTSKHWWLPLEAQQNGYYCGPASAAMVLKAQGYTNVTQTGLAAIMGTTTSGTDLGNIPKGLNKYSKHTYTVKWGSTASSWPATMADLSIGSLISGYGVIYNTVQYKNETARLTGYSNITRDIYHYVAGEGYDSSDPSNRICNYVDPNNITYNGYGRHDIPYRTMGVLCKTRGLVY